MAARAFQTRTSVVFLSGAAVLLLALAGWLGADLVIRFGVGVDSPGTGEGT